MAMNTLFVYDNIAAGILIFIIGFIFHWLGQLVSVIDWDLATRLGLQEDGLPPKYKDYEHAIAMSDVLIGVIYLPVSLGLILDVPLAYRLAWIPGSVFIYHSLNFWFWTKNRRRAGFRFESNALRIGWTGANAWTGILTLAVAWVRL